MKGLAIGIGAYNAMLWRTSIALMLAAALFLWQRGRWPGNSIVRFHIWRGVVTSLMAFLFFWGLVYVPLAEAIGLSFIAPLIALYLAAVLLKEKIGEMAILASLIGFAGALIIIGGKLGGHYSDDSWKGIAAILLSAVLYAYNLILQRQQAQIAEPIEIVFFQNATMVAVYLVVCAVQCGSADHGSAARPGCSGHTRHDLPAIAFLGLCASRGENSDSSRVHCLHLGCTVRLAGIF